MSARRDPLLGVVESFFRDYLQRIRGASPHTVLAYRDALRLFFQYVAARRQRPVGSLTMNDLTVEVVSAFLDHLEIDRRNSVSTRNGRLAALHSFFQQLIRHDPTRVEQYQRVLSLPSKRTRRSVPTYLEPEEMKVVLRQPDRRTPGGARDYALLIFLYNAGARVGETLAIRWRDLHLLRPRQARLHGKGNKDRTCPLWPDTASALRRLRAFPAPDEFVFLNARGQPLSRDGAAHILRRYVELAAGQVPSLRRKRVTPHVLRHSCAVALLQAGVDLSVIRDYLGHESVATTSRYLATNLQMKRKVLEAFWRRAGLTESRMARKWTVPAGLESFLASL